MLCEECGRNEANIYVTAMVNGEKKTQCLCTECVSKKQLFKFDLNELMGELAGKLGSALIGKLPEEMPQPAPEPEKPEEPVSPAPQAACERCGTTWEQYKKTGMLGCPDCYQAFRESLNTLLKGASDTAQHVGRMPEGISQHVSLRMKLDKLKIEMSQAVQAEEYETAARLRDEIRALNRLLEAEHDGE